MNAPIDLGLASTLSANPLAIDSGRIEQVADGIAVCSGLTGAALNESVLIEGGGRGIVFQLDETSVSVGIIDPGQALRDGATVSATGAVLSMPVSDETLGRVLDSLGRPLDGGAPFPPLTERPLFSPSPRIPEIASVTRSLLTGTSVIDAVIPIGRGQRQLILGDRQTGKTQIAIDAILNQRDSGVRCVYVSIGQKMSEVAIIEKTFRDAGAHAYTTIIAESADSGLASQYLAPYAGMALAEVWRANGHDVLIVFDNLTKHADAYRSLSLLMRRSPGREAYPGDIFYIHGSLLERAAQLRSERGGGSITALPIVQTYSDDMSAFIPTNIVSITDGQIYLRPKLANAGQLPAVDLGLSVSRVGRDAQHPLVAALSSGLSLLLARYDDLAQFVGFDNALDDASMKVVRDGEILTHLFRQNAGQPLTLGETIVVLYAFQAGWFAQAGLHLVAAFKSMLILASRRAEYSEIPAALAAATHIDDVIRARLDSLIHAAWDEMVA